MPTLAPSPARAWITAAEAAAELNVSRATLYAYVSRGLVESRGQPGSRKRLYAAADIRRLRSAGDGSAGSPDRALDFGTPLLDSAITLIDGGRLYYRGRDALALAESASLETVAGLLWQVDDADPFAEDDTAADVGGDIGAGPGIAGAIARLALAGRADVAAYARTAPALARTGARIVRHLVAVWAGETSPDGPAPDGPAPAGPAHRVLAHAWGVPAAAEAIRTALVLCADHELNASAFAVRVAASTRTTPYAAVIAGLATLEGPRHGGMTPQTLAMLAEAIRTGDGRATVTDRLRRGESLPGFGHPLYPDGDPRARAVLAAVRAATGPQPLLEVVAAVAEAGREATGLAPNVDFGLATLAATWGLDADRAIGVFAIGRSVGWLAHAAEQAASGQLIRPRARYVGPDPRPAHANRARA
ncbi:MAG: citrate/2-methylcitrate synthase [Thalassobaculum sp.]|uniref:citrate/2-methylcitrate synthase n=1 Tax=Thalassobaculum sp. TaxID=2022740 RepID=UPI0032EC1EA6